MKKLLQRLYIGNKSIVVTRNWKHLTYTSHPLYIHPHILYKKSDNIHKVLAHIGTYISIYKRMVWYTEDAHSLFDCLVLPKKLSLDTTQLFIFRLIALISINFHLKLMQIHSWNTTETVNQLFIVKNVR